MVEVRAVREASEREILDSFAALRPCCMMEVWSRSENTVWPRSEEVRRDVHSVEVVW